MAPENPLEEKRIKGFSIHPKINKSYFRGPLKFLLPEPSPVRGLSISTNDGIAGD